MHRMLSQSAAPTTIMEFHEEEGDKGDRRMVISPEEWRRHYESRKDKEPRALLVAALTYVLPDARGTALDIGACALNDSKYLLEQGFERVTALDHIALAKPDPTVFPPDRFTYTISSMEDFKYPKDTYDLISAQFALPFIDPKLFQAVWRDIVASLAPGGVITCQFFGVRHDPGGRQELVHHEPSEVEELLHGLEVITCELYEKEREDGYVHLINVIARRPNSG